MLVVGGKNAISGSSLDSAELYDPASGRWSATGSLATVRRRHTATLLPGGRVLVAGGTSGGSWLTSAEIYDPASGTWSTTGDITTIRSEHTAVLLQDGRVLISGGWNGTSYLTSAEVYDPATGTWSDTGSLVTARSDHKAMLLPNGNVLIAGGEGSGVIDLDSAEVYDRGAGFQPDWRPILATVTSPFLLGRQLQASGSWFCGYRYSEASGGSTQNSATNYPLVQLRHLDNGQVLWLRPDPATGFSATTYTSAHIIGFPTVQPW